VPTGKPDTYEHIMTHEYDVGEWKMSGRSGRSEFTINERRMIGTIGKRLCLDNVSAVGPRRPPLVM
jgi:hypothetical protein